MPEYIDRAEVASLISAACAECRDSCEEFDGFYADCNQCLLHGVREKLQTIPAADVRPVVRCKDCKHGQGEKMDFWNEYEGIECIGGVVHRKDWFCADGEKREES